jgi:2-keto-3-deoxy-L-rhamnonate aldolase RhmA
MLGTIVTVNSPELVEAMSGAGIDWLCFDLEHSTLTVADAQRMIQAVKPPCLTLIRIESPQAVYVKKALDTGCDGIVIPQVNTEALAREVVEAGKYSPVGNRSVGLGRSTSYGTRLASAVVTDNDEKAIIVQIEHAQAVENLDAILGVPGIDGVFVGPYDLSSSLRRIGDVRHPEVQQKIELIAQRVRMKGLPLGIYVGTDEAVRAESERGFDFVAVGSDILRIVASLVKTVATRETLNPP